MQATHHMLFSEKSAREYMTTEAAKVFHRAGRFAKFSGMLRRVFLPPRLICRIYSLPQGSWRVYWFYLVRLKDLIGRYRQAIYRLWTKTPATLSLAARKSVIAQWLENA